MNEDTKMVFTALIAILRKKGVLNNAEAALLLAEFNNEDMTRLFDQIAELQNNVMTV